MQKKQYKHYIIPLYESHKASPMRKIYNQPTGITTLLLASYLFITLLVILQILMLKKDLYDRIMK
jgi:hypothetical protein